MLDFGTEIICQPQTNGIYEKTLAEKGTKSRYLFIKVGLCPGIILILSKKKTEYHDRVSSNLSNTTNIWRLAQGALKM